MEERKLSNLERIRHERNLSRRELATLSGVRELTINNLERGKNYDIANVKLSTLVKLAKALCCKVVDLLNNDLRIYVA